MSHEPERDAADSPDLDQRERELDALCENWVTWCREHRLYWPPSVQGAAIARSGGATRPLRTQGDEFTSSAASVAAFHIAYTCQPNSLDKQVFDLYYVARVKPIKSAAAALGIGRAHFYRVLSEFRRRVEAASLAFERNTPSGAVAAVASHRLDAEVNGKSVSSGGDTLGAQ